MGRTWCPPPHACFPGQESRTAFPPLLASGKFLSWREEGRERVDSSTSLNFKTFPRPVEVVDPRGCCLFLSELTSRPSPFLRIYVKNRAKNRFIPEYINRRRNYFKLVHFKLVFRMLKVTRTENMLHFTLLKLFEQQISGYFSKRKEKGKLDVN